MSLCFAIMEERFMKRKVKRKHLTSDDRMTIQACLHKSMTITEIARRLGVNKSTISREINKFKVFKNGCYDRCDKRDKLGGICNVCPMRNYCHKDKYYYNFEEAEKASKTLRKSSRSKSKLSAETIKKIDDIVTAGVRLGQSLHHIYVSNKILQTLCCERTIRRLCYRGNLSVRPHELRHYVVYKHKYSKTPEEIRLRDVSVLIGRTYSDYLNYIEHHKRENIVQYDSVIGKITDQQAILTITFPKYNFQFGILIHKNSPTDVRNKLGNLFIKLGKENVKRIFPINIADNGVEFSYFNKIELNYSGERLCKTFFTTPYRSTDKSECERNHEILRYKIPKGKSLDGLTQDMVDDIFSNINSYVRKSKSDRTPYDIVKAKFGKEFLDIIHIRRIPNNKVNLKQIVF